VRDLTEGPIRNHLLVMAIPIAAGMIFQTLYYFVDLYFVAQLGDAAIAGVSIAGNVAFVILALTQMLGIGTVALVSQAAGRKDQAEANAVFNQSVLLSGFLGVLTLIAGYIVTDFYARSMTADAEAARQCALYLYWFLPGLALQFALVAMSSALRGTGIVKPAMVAQIFTVLLNTLLAPILIGGWLTHRPLGVLGAGLASSIAVTVGVLFLWFNFIKLEHYVALTRELLAPRLPYWKKILGIGLPGGAEFGLLFVFTGIIYLLIQHFGSAAQAGFGIGSRVMQGIFLPAMAIAFAAAPVAGQNFGAGKPERVRETFRTASVMGVGFMLILLAVCQWRPDVMIRVFTQDEAVVEVGAGFLHVISLNFVFSGFIFTCSSIFQGLGNTWPSLFSSASRLITFGIPAMWLASRPNFQIKHLWYLSACTVLVQTLTSYALLRYEMRKRLQSPPLMAPAHKQA
jgi:putative MATE family efflux protein